jgi:uncharacterized protein YbjT (DUF2867 family)
MKIAVTGAFSHSGRYIASRLLERGEQVMTLTNHPNRPNPFNGGVKAVPLDFAHEDELVKNLRGADVLVNTYWIRFDRGNNTQLKAVGNTRILVNAAVKAGVRRIVHFSITNPSSDSRLPYFSGKAANEKTVIDSGMSYAILRPTVLFGEGGILVNNIAWMLRRIPLFAMLGDGSCRLAPVYAKDLAELAVNSVYRSDDYVWDAVGPDEFSFREMVALIGRTIGRPRPLVALPPYMALRAAQLIGLLVNDVVLTRNEVDGLMANLLTSTEPPRCGTKLEDWLREHRTAIGKEYLSELAKYY